MRADRQPHAVVVDDLLHCGHEPLPLHVGLRPYQQQEARPVEVGGQVQFQGGLLVGLPVVGVEGHHRTPGPVVEDLVEVEADQHPMLEGIHQMLHGEPARLTGVDETGQEEQQHGRVQLAGLRLLRGELVQPAGIKHLALPFSGSG